MVMTTRYTTDDGRTHEAIGLSWEDIEGILGYPHGDGPGGVEGDDERLVAALLAAGAPEWVRTAPGGIDDWGWYLLHTEG